MPTTPPLGFHARRRFVQRAFASLSIQAHKSLKPATPNRMPSPRPFTRHSCVKSGFRAWGYRSRHVGVKKKCRSKGGSESSRSDRRSAGKPRCGGSSLGRVTHARTRTMPKRFNQLGGGDDSSSSSARDDAFTALNRGKAGPRSAARLTIESMIDRRTGRWFDGALIWA